MTSSLLALLSGAAAARAPVAPAPAGAGPPALAVVRVIDASDGLPADDVLALARDGDVLWVGTRAGLARHDPAGVESWTTADGLPHPVVSALAVDPRSGDLWLGFFGGGLARFSAGRFDTHHQLDSGLAGDVVFAVAHDGARVWAATGGGLSALDLESGDWSLACERRADHETWISSLAVSIPAGSTGAAGTAEAWRGGRLYACAWRERLFVFDTARDARDRAFPAAREVVQGGPEVPGAIAVATAGADLWVATSARVLRVDGEGEPRVERELPPALRALGAVSAMAARDDGEVWIGGDAGLWVSRRGEAGWRELHGPRADGRGKGVLPDERVRALLLDGLGGWVGTATGLARVEWRAAPRAPEVARSAERTAIDGAGAPAPIALLDAITRSIPLPPRHRKSGVPPPAKADLFAATRALSRFRARAADASSAVELVSRPPAFANYGWGLPEDVFVRHVVDERITGAVGTFRAGQRIRAGVLLWAEVPVVNCSASPPGALEEQHPWIFRCPVDDRRVQVQVIDHLVEHRGVRRLAVIRTRAPLARLHLDWWIERAITLQVPPIAEIDGGAELAAMVGEICDLRADAVLTWCGEERAIELLRALRQAGSKAIFVGSDAIVGAALPRALGDATGALCAPAPCPHRLDRAGYEEFARRARRPLRAEAFLTYHATGHLADAVLRAGGAPQAVREALRETARGTLAEWRGGEWRRVPLPVP